MSALYVDLKESGVDWNRPLDISEGDAWKLLTDAANDYAGEFNRMDPDFLRAMANPKLADALEAWHGRPDLPQPVWPDDR